MRYTYDNSADNPRNPRVPPERVRWGQRSFDEMGDLWFQFVTRSEADRGRLNDEILRKMTAEDVIGYETMLRSDPADTELHDDVALLYLSLGQAADAVRHFRATVAAKPSASAHYNLATALSVAGALDDAVREYEAALRLKPDYGSALNNLGSVLAAQGRLADAIGHFREAARLDPASVQAHRNLAWYVATMSNESGAMAEAVAAGERAAALTGRRDAQVLDALAAAYAAAGRFDDAIATAERAVALAGDDLAREVRERLAHYRRHTPYRIR
jgi:tetratricopeptide (TPR) repeat protein